MLSADGMSHHEIARLTGIPRSTVSNWVSGKTPPLKEAPPLPHVEYAYLLGIYLGDGYLFKHPRTWRLHVYQDAAYPGIIEEISNAIRMVAPGRRVNVYKRDSRCVDISAYFSRWFELFPQHGPGRKHERRIILADWQKPIVDGCARAFVRGLIQSDGCRIIARQRGRDRYYEYPRYLFANRSEDIKALFCVQLDRLGISWNRPNDWEIQISRREAVRALDEFVGPKL